MLTFFSAFFLMSLTLFGGFVLSELEGWTLQESFYFCWVSFTTIGFGDFAPEVGEDWDFQHLAVLIAGWHIVTFVISVLEKLLTYLNDLEWWSDHYLWPKEVRIRKSQQTEFLAQSSFRSQATLVNTDEIASFSLGRTQPIIEHRQNMQWAVKDHVEPS